MANLLYRYGHDILFILVSYLFHHSSLFPKFSFAWSFEISEASGANFQGLQDTLERRPSWATWDEAAACVPDKDAKARDIGAAIGLVCNKGVFDCGQIPDTCNLLALPICMSRFLSLGSECAA